jgi:2-oxoglutarate dehydrogenase complex dehydrogenase (E1) component-like enzyme
VLYAGRAPAAAPATGLAKIHETEQKRLIEAALHAAAVSGIRKSSNDRN